jgi:hypothetical protein
MKGLRYAQLSAVIAVACAAAALPAWLIQPGWGVVCLLCIGLYGGGSVVLMHSWLRERRDLRLAQRELFKLASPMEIKAGRNLMVAYVPVGEGLMVPMDEWVQGAQKQALRLVKGQ